MRKVTMLDDTDEMLLKTLSKHPRISQVELAKKVGLTQPAVSLRLRKLERTRVINDPGVAIDASTLGLKMMRVDLQTRESSKLTEKFSRCPAVVDSYALEGNKGMCMILAGESKPFLNCMVMRHLKKNPDVRSVRSEHIATSMHGLKPSMDCDQKLDAPPCGDLPCNTCEYYMDNGGECPGCPMTKFYKGKFWR